MANIIELTEIEKKEITGGGFFKDAGQWCHEAWNAIVDYFS